MWGLSSHTGRLLPEEKRFSPGQDKRDKLTWPLTSLCDWLNSTGDSTQTHKHTLSVTVGPCSRNYFKRVKFSVFFFFCTVAAAEFLLEDVNERANRFVCKGQKSPDSKASVYQENVYYCTKTLFSAGYITKNWFGKSNFFGNRFQNRGAGTKNACIFFSFHLKGARCIVLGFYPPKYLYWYWPIY